MEYEKIKQLMDDMGNSKLTSVDIEFPNGIKIKMEKKNETNTINIENLPTSDIKTNASAETKTISIPEKTIEENEVKGEIVKSPMIGTFYAKPSPTSNPYVEVGTEVKKGDVLCIIEAMKLMNEIEAEYSGKIAEILVKDGDPVDYGKPLFRIV